jgi:hypothetical protein
VGQKNKGKSKSNGNGNDNGKSNGNGNGKSNGNGKNNGKSWPGEGIHSHLRRIKPRRRWGTQTSWLV